MQNTLLENNQAICMLVEVIAANSQNIKWTISLDGVSVGNEKIRRVSIDKFYELVTNDVFAFKKLCMALPQIIDDVVSDLKLEEKSNTVLAELQAIDKNLMKSLYLLSFKKYQGFHDFNI